ncbi:MAG: DUF456 domain-containing protein [Gemmatimonadaceae bacterium]|nr:DUF456 domain-containing protein [Gemmatimonadaceae bacterium]
MEMLLLTAVIVISLVLVVFGLPGLWVMIASAVCYRILLPDHPISWFTIVAITILAIVAEVFEFTLTGKYARKYGGSRRAGWGAIIGGFIGMMVGIPVPIIGSVIGAFAGSFVGAFIAEISGGQSNTAGATRVATGALIGRVVATAMKVGIGCAIAAWILVAAWR